MSQKLKNVVISGTNLFDPGDDYVLDDVNYRKENLGAPSEKLLLNQDAHSLPSVLISVIITCYNYGKYLEESVESVVAQTFRDFEIIIVNDGSTDNSLIVAEELVIKYSGSVRIKLINQSNSGQPAISRNNGIRESKGKYILCLDADDKIAPDMLLKSLLVIESDPELGVVYTHRQDFDGCEKLVLAQEYNFNILKYRNILSVCSLFRKEAWEKVNGYRTNVKGFEDWDFWIAIGAAGFRGKLIPEPLFLYRRHGTGLFNDAVKNQEKLIAQIVLNNKTVYTLAEISRAEGVINNIDRPAFSIIIPTYNRKDKLLTAVKSVLAQTFKDFEIIVINDAGDSPEYELKKLNDSRIKYIQHDSNIGLSAARNTGLKTAKGKYIAFLDDDDIYYPFHLETLLQHLQTGNSVIYSDAVRAVYENEKLIYKSVPYSIDYDRNKLLLGNIAPVNCFAFERSLLDTCGLFDESISVLEDWEFWLRLSAVSEFKHIKAVTSQVNWIRNSSSLTNTKQADFNLAREKIYSKYENEIKLIPDINKIIDEFNFIWRNDFVEGRPLVSIVVLTYNGLDYTKSFIDSIFRYTKTPFELILVDNASNDDTPVYLIELTKTRSNIKVILNKENKGFPAGLTRELQLRREVTSCSQIMIL
jgi:glycosyltransferase involved in cell wall biosynthesis